jgi:hypothetical protein
MVPAVPNYGAPTRYSAGGVPEYGLVGGEIWHVAGLVNFGEPTVGVVYDETMPGANTSAGQLVAALQAQMRQQGTSQPGVTTGLSEAGDTAHYKRAASGLQRQPDHRSGSCSTPSPRTRCLSCRENRARGRPGWPPLPD